ncbi:MAG: PRC-barrel domain-containing protein, partial [Rhodospirillales bacterium]|nr:PRC-barrel domain-containing protein [Rhodospirillales bacterium]
MAKHPLAATAMAAVLAFAAAPSWAAGTANTGDNPPAGSSHQALQEQSGSGGGEVNGKPFSQVPLAATSDIRGSTVRNGQGETLGSIENLVFDTSQGRLVYAVLGTGGFLGLGEKSVAVPWTALKLSGEEGGFVLNMDKERLRNAPSIDSKDVRRLTERQVGEAIYAYFGEMPYWQQDAPQTQQASAPAAQQSGPQQAAADQNQIRNDVGLLRQQTQQLRQEAQNLRSEE